MLRIAPEPDRRRYEPSGMTTSAWKQLAPEVVNLGSIVLQQDSVDIAALLAAEPPLHDEYPHVVIWQGELYLSDGHHRVVRAAVKGERYIMARVKRIADVDHKHRWTRSLGAAEFDPCACGAELDPAVQAVADDYRPAELQATDA